LQTKIETVKKEDCSFIPRCIGGLVLASVISQESLTKKLKRL